MTVPANNDKPEHSSTAKIQPSESHPSYRVKVRHVNCRKRSQSEKKLSSSCLTTVNWRPSQANRRLSQILSDAISSEALGTGCCGAGEGIVSETDVEMLQDLERLARGVCDEQSDHIRDIVVLREHIIWESGPPKTHNGSEEIIHGSAVTPIHLALMRQRNVDDFIEVEFGTHYDDEEFRRENVIRRELDYRQISSPLENELGIGWRQPMSHVYIPVAADSIAAVVDNIVGVGIDADGAAADGAAAAAAAVVVVVDDDSMLGCFAAEMDYVGAAAAAAVVVESMLGCFAAEMDCRDEEHEATTPPAQNGVDTHIYVPYYTVVWIAPLDIEARAALSMMDNIHDGRFPMSRGDDYVFIAGDMLGHNIVVATLPAGQEYGTGSAAALATGLPNLSRKPVRDIRLGDVIVALPDGESAENRRTLIQIALAYAYSRSRDITCPVFWVHADTETSFAKDYQSIARKLSLTTSLGGEDLLRAVRERIEEIPNWVLVLDNADDLALFGVAQSKHPSPSGSGLNLNEDQNKHLRKENELTYDVLHSLDFVDNQDMPFDLIREAARLAKKRATRPNQSSNDSAESDRNEDSESEDDNLHDTREVVTRICEFSFLNIRTSD
ncbi:hypothetical protein CHU98_g5922 [Xylaria longipes]|nr:hypothetical protein CHU98_g5922 [Xylaria longipes]